MDNEEEAYGIDREKKIGRKEKQRKERKSNQKRNVNQFLPDAPNETAQCGTNYYYYYYNYKY